MPNDIVSRAIDAVCAGDHLTADHASAVLSEIMEGRADPVQTGAFLTALRAKGGTVPELVGLARTMRSLAAPVSSSRSDLVDTAGTAGGPPPFNVSPPAAAAGGRGRGRLRRRQARQPLQHQQVRLRRPPRGAWGGHGARARGGRALPRRG